MGFIAKKYLIPSGLILAALLSGYLWWKGYSFCRESQELKSLRETLNVVEAHRSIKANRPVSDSDITRSLQQGRF